MSVRLHCLSDHSEALYIVAKWWKIDRLIDMCWYPFLSVLSLILNLLFPLTLQRLRLERVALHLVPQFVGVLVELLFLQQVCHCVMLKATISKLRQF